jgi:hypothetical protein
MGAPVLWSVVSLALLAVRTLLGGAAPSAAVAAASPYLVALALLAVQRRALGLALAAGAALAQIAASALLLVGWLGTGDAHASGAAIAHGLAAGLLVPIQILLADACRRALPRLGSTERLSPPLLAVAVAAPAVLRALMTLMGVASGTDWDAVRAQQEGEAAARAAVDAVVRCASEHAARLPARGFPAALPDFGPGGLGCLDAEAAAGRLPHYRLEYLPGVPDAAGRVPRFAVCARPLDVRRGGVHTIVSDASGRVAEYVPRTAADLGAGRALPCADTWFAASSDGSDGRRGVEHCLLRWAATHPERGYPPALREIGPLGDACLPAEAASSLDGLGYAPAPPGADGVVRDFTLGSTGSVKAP